MNMTANEDAPMHVVSELVILSHFIDSRACLEIGWSLQQVILGSAVELVLTTYILKGQSFGIAVLRSLRLLRLFKVTRQV